MMKPFFSLALFIVLLAGPQAFAQSSVGLRINQLSFGNVSVAPTPDVDFEFDAHTISGEVFYLHQLGGKSTLRLRAGASSTSFSSETSARYNSATEEDKTSFEMNRMSYTFAPGLMTPILKMERARIYTGVDLPVQVVGQTSGSYESTYYDWNDDIYTDEGEVEMDGGFTVAVAPLIGLQYKFGNNFFVGTEVLSGFQYATIGDELSYNSTSTSPSGRYTDSGSADATGTYIGMMPVQLSFTVGFQFGSPDVIEDVVE